MVLKLRMNAFAAALALATILAAGAPAQAQGMLDSMMGLLGLKPADETPDIDYRERAPLVVPPQMKLRAPEAAPATRTAAWPNDPDVARRAAEAKAARTPRPNARDSNIGDGKLVRPGDVPGGRTYSQTTSQEPVPFEKERESGWVSPDKLKSMGTKAPKETLLVAGQEPPRRYLTDPPSGLRVPSNNAPLTAGKSLVKPLLSEKEEKDPLNTFRPKPKTDDDE